MARTRQTGVQDAAADAAGVPAPPAAPSEANKDDNDLLPSRGEEEEEHEHNLDNINAHIRESMIAMYERVLSFKEEAATALYNDQQITDLDSLRKLYDPRIKELCRAIGKEDHPISMISQNHLKLLVFWEKHIRRTLRGMDDLSDIDYNQDIKHLQAQKAFEDGLDGSKEPDAPTMTITPANAVASFTLMKTHLAKCRGTTGLPLEYVVCPQLKGPHDAPEDEPEDPPSFSNPDSPYVTIDAELIACAPIL